MKNLFWQIKQLRYNNSDESDSELCNSTSPTPSSSSWTKDEYYPLVRCSNWPWSNRPTHCFDRPRPLCRIWGWSWLISHEQSSRPSAGRGSSQQTPACWTLRRPPCLLSGTLNERVFLCRSFLMVTSRDRQNLYPWLRPSCSAEE